MLPDNLLIPSLNSLSVTAMAVRVVEASFPSLVVDDRSVSTVLANYSNVSSLIVLYVAGLVLVPPVD